jgi:hypothetical protein
VLLSDLFQKYSFYPCADELLACGPARRACTLILTLLNILCFVPAVGDWRCVYLRSLTPTFLFQRRDREYKKMGSMFCLSQGKQAGNMMVRWNPESPSVIDGNLGRYSFKTFKLGLISW